MGSKLVRNNTTYPKELSLSRIGLDHGGHEIVQCIEPNRVQNWCYVRAHLGGI